MRKVVVNTTPLIALADVGQLEILHKLYGEIQIPCAVHEEIKSEPAKSQIRASSWIKVVEIKDETQKKLYRARLHAGEVEVMILAGEANADLVIMDDNAAKKTAKYMGFAVTGTFGVLIKAKTLGYIESVEPIVDALIDDGLYVTDSLREMILRKAGERP